MGFPQICGALQPRAFTLKSGSIAPICFSLAHMPSSSGSCFGLCPPCQVHRPLDVAKVQRQAIITNTLTDQHRFTLVSGRLSRAGSGRPSCRHSFSRLDT